MEYMTIACDLHIGAPNEINKTFDEIVQCDLLLGDIVDLANCDKSKMRELKHFHDKIYERFGDRYIRGNHERTTIRNEYKIIGDTICAHGDFESWGSIRAMEYRSNEWGASWFKRMFIVPTIMLAEKTELRNVYKKTFLNSASSLAKNNNCKRYICGHFHVKEITRINHNDVEIVILPRGISRI